MKTEKLIFLVFFFLVSFCAFSQKSDNQSKKNEKKSYVLLETPYGNMKIVLYNDTPLHKENFLKLVKDGFYQDLLFHRIIKNFMIQGGDPESRNAKPGQMLGNGGPGYTVPAEFVATHFHKKGALAAARQGDMVNPKKASSGSQFYIVQGQKWTEQQLMMMAQQRGVKWSPEQIQIYTTIGGTPHLDNEYTVFGEVIEGLDVIDKIAALPCGPADRPLADINMKIRIIEK